MKPDIGFAQHVAAGETECGDVVRVLSGEQVTTVALADGAGHGPQAREAAERFCAAIERHAAAGLEQLVRLASDDMASTRGAAVAVLRIDSGAGRMQFAGVGNIEVQSVCRERVRPISVPGVLGRRVRKVVCYEYAAHEGDLIVLYSDGISRRMVVEDYARLPVQLLAERVLAAHGLAHDDATCIAVRL
ncbi:MAG: SpoIIE family protein phosphatase [Deltaproteobacteria bacterium]|nr:SpoIIE family protein phosphatase [Deltaproteobacteria bacterium]